MLFVLLVLSFGLFAAENENDNANPRHVAQLLNRMLTLKNDLFVMSYEFEGANLKIMQSPTFKQLEKDCESLYKHFPDKSLAPYLREVGYYVINDIPLSNHCVYNKLQLLGLTPNGKYAFVKSGDSAKEYYSILALSHLSRFGEKILRLKNSCLEPSEKLHFLYFPSNKYFFWTIEDKTNEQITLYAWQKESIAQRIHKTDRQMCAIFVNEHCGIFLTSNDAFRLNGYLTTSEQSFECDLQELYSDNICGVSLFKSVDDKPYRLFAYRQSIFLLYDVNEKKFFGYKTPSMTQEEISTFSNDLNLRMPLLMKPTDKKDINILENILIEALCWMELSKQNVSSYRCSSWDNKSNYVVDSESFTVYEEMNDSKKEIVSRANAPKSRLFPLNVGGFVFQNKKNEVQYIKCPLESDYLEYLHALDKSVQNTSANNNN